MPDQTEAGNRDPMQAHWLPFTPNRQFRQAPLLEDAVHAFRGAPGVQDIRNIGILAAIELAPVPGAPGKHAAATGNACLDGGILIRTGGDTLMLSPPLILTEADIGRVVDGIGRHIRKG